MKKLIFGVVIGLFAVATTASAAALTQQQIDAVLSLLRAFGADTSVVANVESALSGKAVPAAPAAWCYTFDTNMGVGMKGKNIAMLHIALGKDGFSIPDGEGPQKDGETINDTYFGEFTASAVTAFQEKYRSEILTPNGLSHGTGYVGTATRKKLNQLYGCGNKDPMVGSRTMYHDSSKRFSFSYPTVSHGVRPSIVTSSKTTIPGLDRSTAYDGIELRRVINVPACGGSGICQPTTNNPAIGFYIVPVEFENVKNKVSSFIGSENSTALGSSGISAHTGAEGEGLYYYIVPFGSDRTFVVTRSYLDERNILSYNGKPNFLTIAQQEGYFRDVVATLSLTPNGNVVACTQDAKQCPDGSYVSRTGPKCEFAPCGKIISSVKVYQGNVDVIDGKGINKDGVIEITDSQGKITNVIAKGSTFRDIDTDISPSGKYLFYGWTVGDGVIGFIYDFADNKSHEVNVSTLKPAKWLSDGKFDYWVGCVTNYCRHYRSKNSERPWEVEQVY